MVVEVYNSCVVVVVEIVIVALANPVAEEIASSAVIGSSKVRGKQLASERWTNTRS